MPSNQYINARQVKLQSLELKGDIDLIVEDIPIKLP